MTRTLCVFHCSLLALTISVFHKGDSEPAGTTAAARIRGNRMDHQPPLFHVFTPELMSKLLKNVD